MSGNLPNFNDTSRNKELLNKLVENEARDRLNNKSTSKCPPQNLQSAQSPFRTPQASQHQNFHSLHEMNTQTSQPWLPNSNQTPQQFKPNILRDPNLKSHLDKKKVKYTTWKQRFKDEIIESKRRTSLLREEIIDINIREAKLRDQRDRQAKRFYNLATVDYFLIPDLANVFGELSKNQANVSNYHEAMLNRVDAKTCQELELIPDLLEQLKTQLEVYSKAREDFDKEHRRSMLGNQSKGWLGFFQPSKKKSFGNQYGNQFGNQFGGQFNQNHLNNPERAPSQLHILAKKCKEALSDLEEIVDRYFTQVFEHHKKALKMMAKAYIEYHCECLEIYTKEWNDIENFNPGTASLAFCESLGLKDLKNEVEGFIKSTSNTAMFEREMQMMNSLQQNQREMMMSPWKSLNNGMGGYNGGSFGGGNMGANMGANMGGPVGGNMPGNMANSMGYMNGNMSQGMGGFNHSPYQNYN